MDSPPLPVRIQPRLLTRVVTWSVRHSAAVETVVAPALETYLRDVDLRLLDPPPSAPGYLGRITHGYE